MNANQSEQKNFPEVPRLLVVINSAGSDPWRSIEQHGQEQTFGAEVPPWASLVWIEGDVGLSTRIFYRLMNFLASLFLASFHRFRLGTIRLFFFNRGLVPPGIFAIYSAIAERALKKKPKRNGNRVSLAFPPLYYLTGVRTLNSFSWALENYHFDFLLKTTSTSYIEWENLRKAVLKLPRERTYAGATAHLGKSVFNSGAASIFSRDVVESILHHRKSFRWDTYEDVAVGEIIGAHNLADFTNLEQIELEHGLRNQSFVPGSDVFLYRCKTSRTNTDCADLPIARMLELHRKICEYRESGTGSAASFSHQQN